MQKILIGLALIFGMCAAHADVQTQVPTPIPTGSYFDWGRGSDGYGYCFQFTWNGQVLNQGRPVPERYCEEVEPSHVEWSEGTNGYAYCYQYTPDQLPMWQGRPVQNNQCEFYFPSHYAWSQGTDGWTHCYQYTPDGIPLNDGRPVPNAYCGGRSSEKK